MKDDLSRKTCLRNETDYLCVMSPPRNQPSVARIDIHSTVFEGFMIRARTAWKRSGLWKIFVIKNDQELSVCL